MGANGCGRERTCNRICNRKLWEIAKTGGHGIGVGISFASTGLPDLQSSVNDVSPNMKFRRSVERILLEVGKVVSS